MYTGPVYGAQVVHRLNEEVVCRFGSSAPYNVTGTLYSIKSIQGLTNYVSVYRALRRLLTKQAPLALCTRLTSIMVTRAYLRHKMFIGG